MEGSSLFNPGFLGGGFNWWIGQIADDSTWRDNIIPGVYQHKDTQKGWGRRYKVRIIGLHDQGEESIPSEELPWANVMYPITAGGFQQNAGATPALRQGNMVFGFFLDGPDQQVPCIMGVMGNNAQTPLSFKIGDSRVSNTTPGTLATSGYAEGQNSLTGNAKPKPPDSGKITYKPTSSEINDLRSVQQSTQQAQSTGGDVDEYGLPIGTPRTPEMLSDIEELTSVGEGIGLIGDALNDFIGEELQKRINTRIAVAESAAAPVNPGATTEDDSVMLLTADDVKQQKVQKKKITLLKPGKDSVTSAIKAIQTAIDNLINEIDSYLSSLNSYIDAVGGALDSLNSLQNFMGEIACEIARYMKVIMDQIMQYVLKLLNKELTKVVAAMPSSMRYMFGDMKEIITELITCLYNKLTESMCELILSLLEDAFPLEEMAEKMAEEMEADDDRVTTPQVPMCYAEDLVGSTLAIHKEEITETNQTILDNISTFLDDIESQLAGITDIMGDITGMLGDITGSMTAALSFENLTLNILGCELEINPAINDYFTISEGGSSQGDTQLPSEKSVENVAAGTPPSTNIPPKDPYLQPQSGTTPNQNLRRD